MAGWNLEIKLVQTLRLPDGTIKTAVRQAPLRLELPPLKIEAVKERAREVLEARGLKYRSASFSAARPRTLIVYASEGAPLRTRLESGRVFREPPRPPKP